MKKFIFLLFILSLSNVCFSQTYKKEIAVLTLLEIDSENKTILLGDGVSTFYWRFRIPKDKWEIALQNIQIEHEVVVSWVGPELHDPALNSTSDEYNGICVLKELFIYKPVKVF